MLQENKYDYEEVTYSYEEADDDNEQFQHSKGRTMMSSKDFQAELEKS